MRRHQDHLHRQKRWGLDWTNRSNTFISCPHPSWIYFTARLSVDEQYRLWHFIRVYCECNIPWKWIILYKITSPHPHAFDLVCTCSTKLPWLDVPVAVSLSLLALGGKLLLPTLQSQLFPAIKPAAARNFISVINLRSCSAVTSQSSYVGPAPIYNLAVCLWGLCAVLCSMPCGW